MEGRKDSNIKNGIEIADDASNYDLKSEKQGDFISLSQEEEWHKLMMENEKLKEKLVELELKSQEEGFLVNALQEERKNSKMKNDKMTNENSFLQKKLYVLQSESRDSIKQVGELEESLFWSMAAEEELGSKCRELEHEVEILTQKNEVLSTECDRLKKELEEEEICGEMAESEQEMYYEKELTEAYEIIGMLRKENKSLSNNMQLLQNRLCSLEGESSELRVTAKGELKSELEPVIDSLRGQVSQGIEKDKDQKFTDRENVRREGNNDCSRANSY